MNNFTGIIVSQSMHKLTHSYNPCTRELKGKYMPARKQLQDLKQLRPDKIEIIEA